MPRVIAFDAKGFGTLEDIELSDGERIVVAQGSRRLATLEYVQRDADLYWLCVLHIKGNKRTLKAQTPQQLLGLASLMCRVCKGEDIEQADIDELYDALRSKRMA